jgi:hypothetical protein
MERRGTPPFILNLSNRWSLGAVSLMSWLLNTWGKNPQYPFNRREGMLHNPTRNFGEEKISHSCWELNPNSSSSWPSYYTDCSKPTHPSASSDCWHYKFPNSCQFSAAYITPVQAPVCHFTTQYVSCSERQLDTLHKSQRQRTLCQLSVTNYSKHTPVTNTCVHK